MATSQYWKEGPIEWKTINIFSKRSRSLEIFIENETVHTLKLVEDYLDSGEIVEFTFKKVLIPESSWLTLVASKSHSIAPAVGGGLKYRLEGKDHILYIGFSSPFRGDPVSFVCLSNVEHPVKWAYDEAKDGSFKSSEFGERRITAEMVNARYCASKRIVFRLQ
ncbi:hypothetical protein CHS0354_037492 [Potamilus streckersoni]|uniref:Uncharacterized protein n=1 Tax=Potamilus streckersoni TaxID=2493646 RepID=A0AAE0VGV4_9BIVA|nr:hypothetical protein CHS0354_037492 [Potamilus streckersoni]